MRGEEVEVVGVIALLGRTEKAGIHLRFFRLSAAQAQPRATESESFRGWFSGIQGLGQSSYPRDSDAHEG